MLRLAVLSALMAAGPLGAQFQPAQFEELSFDYNGEHYAYRLLTPPHVERGEHYPLLVFLHGAGERGRDNELSLKYLPEVMARSPYRDRHPAYVLVAQCREGQRWVEADWAAKRSSRMRPDPSPMMAMAMALVDKALRTLPIDLERVYLAGISMGGYGAWELAARRPGTFAALVPVCGGGDETTARLLASTPIWAWHGGADNVVWPERTRSMIEAIQKAGGTPKYTEREIPGGQAASRPPLRSSAEKRDTNSQICFLIPRRVPASGSGAEVGRHARVGDSRGCRRKLRAKFS